MEISWTGCVKNEEIFRGVKEERNIYVKQEEGRLTRLVISCRNCLLKHFIEEKVQGKIEVMER
jgi:hypothetical protein